MPVYKRIDVRRLLARGIEPLAEIQRRVDELGSNEGITVVAPFLPSPLIELLRSQGFHSRVEQLGEGAWAVHFSRDEA